MLVFFAHIWGVTDEKEAKLNFAAAWGRGNVRPTKSWTGKICKSGNMKYINVTKMQWTIEYSEYPPPTQRMFPSFLVLDVLTARQLRWKGERVKMLNTGIYSRIVGTVFPAVQKNICSSVWTIAMNLLYLPKFQQFCIVMVELLSLQEKFWIIKLGIGLIWVKPKEKLISFAKLKI